MVVDLLERNDWIRGKGINIVPIILTIAGLDGLPGVGGLGDPPPPPPPPPGYSDPPVTLSKDTVTRGGIG